MAWVKPSSSGGSQVLFANNENERLAMENLKPGQQVFQLDEGIMFIWDGQIWHISGASADDSAHSHGNKSILDKITSSGSGSIITNAERTKLSGIDPGANRYIHPESHPATMITQTSTHRFVTDQEKQTWSNKQDVLGFIPENIANKGIADGYAPLNSAGRLDSLYLQDSVVVQSEIVPASNKAANLGSSSKAFNKIFVSDIHLSEGSVFFGATPVLGKSLGLATLRAGQDENIVVRSYGVGSSRILSEQSVYLETTSSNSSIDLRANSSGGKINIQAANTISLSASETNLSGIVNVDGTLNATNLTISGNVSVLGEQFLINAEVVQVKDNIIEINKGETGSGVTAGKAGLRVDRGSAPDYFMVFDESTQTFSVGMDEDLQVIATRDYVDSVRYSHPETHSIDIITETDTKKIMTSAERIKLSEIETGANKYTHPSTHPASMIDETALRRFVTDAEKSSWNAKWVYDEDEIKAIKVNNAINADTVGGFTVGINVPASAKFTDTIYTHPTSSATSILNLTGSYVISEIKVNNGHITDMSTRQLGSSSQLNAVNPYDAASGVLKHGGSLRSSGAFYSSPTSQPISTEHVINIDAIFRASELYEGDIRVVTDGDSRLSDPRTPLGHGHSASDIGSGVFAAARIPTISYNKTDFANQALNKNSDVTFKTVAWTGGNSSEANAAYTHSQSAHAPSNAWVYNEATIKAVKVNSAINADTVNGLTVLAAVPANAKFTDTVYTHPSSHPASIITQDANNRFVTDAQINAWNAKGSSNLTLGTTSSTAYRGDHGLIAYNHSQSAHNYLPLSGGTLTGTLRATDFATFGSPIARYSSTRAELGIIAPGTGGAMLQLGCDGEKKWGLETRASTENYAFSLYSWEGHSHVVRILKSGNVGMGTVAPAEKLHVAGKTRSDEGFKTGDFDIVYDATSKCLQFNFIG